MKTLLTLAGHPPLRLVLAECEDLMTGHRPGKTIACQRRLPTAEGVPECWFNVFCLVPQIETGGGPYWDVCLSREELEKPTPFSRLLVPIAIALAQPYHFTYEA